MATKKSFVPKVESWFDPFKRFLNTLPPEEAMKPTKYEAAFKAGWEAAKNPPPAPTAQVEQVVTAIEEAAKQWEESHEKTWGPNSEKADHKMVQCGKDDARDLRTVASLVKERKFKEARQRAANLDTIVRDELPNSFFHLLDQNGFPW